MHYLDNAATTRVADAVADAACRGAARSILPTLLRCTRPARSSEMVIVTARGRPWPNVPGRAARAKIVFTACGTEGDNIAVFGAAKARRRLGRPHCRHRLRAPRGAERGGRAGTGGLARHAWCSRTARPCGSPEALVGRGGLQNGACDGHAREQRGGFRAGRGGAGQSGEAKKTAARLCMSTACRPGASCRMRLNANADRQLCGVRP